VTKSRSLMLLPALALACAAAQAPAASLQPGTPCNYCRMTVSSQNVAAQIAAPGEDPRFFDDIGCLASYLREHPLTPGAVLYVGDHQTGKWIDARVAVYSRGDAITTPMYSHIVAHADARARESDASVKGAKPLTAADVFGTTLGGANGK
jgi:copper chaperone NosL